MSLAPSRRFGRGAVTATLLLVVASLVLPVLLTFVGSFASEWSDVLPSGFVTLQNWREVLGLAETVGSQRSMGWDTLVSVSGYRLAVPSELIFSVGLALCGVLINLVVGVPIAYAVARYGFRGDEWVNAISVLPLVPGVILGVAFLRAYPDLSGTSVGLIVGYSLLKAPFMVMAVRSEFESMPLRRLEESARSLGASWPRTFFTVIVPNARSGIVSGAIICWTLAAAEFNFSYVVWAKGTQPLALFLQRHISNSSFTKAAAAVSMFFCIIVAITLLLQQVGSRGFDIGG
ncbi:ABC transporter permease subunit [Halobacterium salinarum]|uniref:ABC-type transport system permease protein n=1 Tax=Halobacterium salinarum (strain ATCC 29341 / DSM 671 / R1) TaxID=478009 RepID=B0RA04_HALS3|nr:ABC transporter permease subunit [Halobacterium salinarum]MDL0137920.1 ABC transporter permease subunit [Halobacterium salinarum]QRY21505.1 ABC transporter permease subunit [Halobacterium sp. GSL-19]CAP15599.2 ABC-type transport system permease protein [Halobacterium salinarum R1]